MLEQDSEPIARKIFLIDSAWNRELVRHLRLFRYQLHKCHALPEVLNHTEVFGVICTLEHAVAHPDIAAQIEKLGGLLLVISEAEDFPSRLAAVRLHARGFFVHPLRPSEVVEQLERWVPPPKREPFRILFYDDAEHRLDSFVRHFSNAGMFCQAIDEPIQLLSKIRDWSPDLLVFELHAERCSGIEMAAIVRQHQEFLGIPIILVSNQEIDSSTAQKIRLYGGEFFSKQTNIAHLIEIAQFRADRSRQLRSLANRDSLTGLLNHARIKRMLSSEVARAGRHRSSLAFVMLDIDNFKSINDRYGHLIGDKVIRALSRLLRDRFRINDSVGRYGGEEFAIVMPRCVGQDALRIFDELREQFAQLRFTHQEVEFSATFSAGVATFHDGMSAEELNRRADVALYQAKNNGKNQVSLLEADLALPREGNLS